mgnify:CR=1 FL=1
MTRSVRSLWILVITLVVMACASSQAPLHQTAGSSLPKNIGLHGYSPISYFEKNQAELGDMQFSYSYKGKMYYFASAGQVETFKADPMQYIPRYGEYCPYSLALGRRVGIDPTNFKIHDGQLLLFHNKIELSTVDVDAQANIYEKADKEFLLLTF